MHLFADFCMQTKNQAMSKSSNNKMLASHVTDYTFFMVLVFTILCLLISPKDLFGKQALFAIITWSFHFGTDYVSSRLTKAAREKEQYYGINGFFAIISYDQMLHFIQIFLTYYYVLYS